MAQNIAAEAGVRPDGFAGRIFHGERFKPCMFVACIVADEQNLAAGTHKFEFNINGREFRFTKKQRHTPAHGKIECNLAHGCLLIDQNFVDEDAVVFLAVNGRIGKADDAGNIGRVRHDCGKGR